MKKSPIIKATIFTSIILTPLVTFAVTGTVTVQDAITGIGATAILIQLFTSTVVKALGTLALSLGLLAFFYGIIEYIWAKRSGDSKGVQVGGDFIKYGLIALFVMFSVYGIIKLGQSILFQGKDVTTIDIPSFNFRTGTTGGTGGTGSAGNNGTGGVTGSTGNNGTGGVTGSTGNNGTGGTAVYSCNTDSYTLAQCQSGCSGSWNSANSTCSTPINVSNGTTGSGGGASTGNVNADCTSNSECTSGLVCYQFKCQSVANP